MVGKELFDIIKNKDFFNLTCRNCKYGYDGVFSGKIFSDDIFVHEDHLFILISCENCEYTKIVVCDIIDNFDIARIGNNDIWDYLLKIYKFDKNNENLT
jgi:predicted nucleic-acid-binding Zn-ribbon protein